jgi:hypothetical protein
MTNRQQRRHPPQTETKAKTISVMQALETAVLLMEQGGETEESIMKYVHLIHLGLIRDGRLTDEYLQLAAQAQAEREQATPEIVVVETPGSWGHR